MSRVLVTGAGGFVGTRLCAALRASGCTVRRAVRTPGASPADAGVEEVRVGEIDGATRWDAALDGVDGVVHLAARVHQMGAGEAGLLAEYRRVNAEGTAALARAAAAAGVRRMVFVSSVKVNGEATHGTPFRPDDAPAPADPYGVSKWEGEQALWETARATPLEGVVVRPPLVYGPGVRANFLQLLRAVDRGLPIPLGSVRNRRSLVYVGNLADLLVVALRHPAAAGHTLLAADGPPLSTPELVRAIAAALGRPARLLPAPPAALRLAGRLLGRSAAVDRLCGDLAVDETAAIRLLGWSPPYTTAQGLAATAEWLRGARRGEGR
jgi:nucleoside-diphosphate-sugar epimerase